MMKKFILPLSFAFMMAISCDSDNCDCVKKTYTYGDSYPTYKLTDVDCPEGMVDEEIKVEYLSPRIIDYTITKTCN